MISTAEATCSALPARRADLVVRSLGENERFVVKDPRNGAYYQLGEQEHFLLMQLDGTRTVDAVCVNFAERFRQVLSPEELDQFGEMARRRGFLQNQPQSQGHGDTAANRVAESDSGGATQPRRQSILYWRKNFFDPDRVFSWLAPRLSFFWTPPFLVVSGGCIALAAVVFWANRREVASSVAHALNWELAVVTCLVLAMVTILHESAHGLTCRRYGGEVHEIGFLLIYLQPAFYCNVSDAWLFRDKSKRMWVTFAGAYFELFLWGLATLVWRATDTSVWLNHLALVFMTVSGIATLFNLNPLIKLDGYYLLSDYLEIPNLRRLAFRYLGSVLKRFWRRTGQNTETVPARERRIYWTYGLLAGTYSFWFLGVVIVWFANYLVGSYQGWGFVILVALLAVVFRRSLRRCLAGVTSVVRSWERAWKAARWLLRVTTPVAVFVAAAVFFRMELKVTGEFTISPAENSDVRTEVEGIIKEIRVEEGDVVVKGDVIARLSERDYLAKLQETKAEIEEKRAKLKLLKAGSRPEEIKLAKTIIAKAEDRLEYAKGRMEMDAKRLVSFKELQETKEILGVRQKEFEEGKDTLNVLLAGSRPEEIEATEAGISRLRAQERHVEEQLKLLLVLSPIPGVVTTHKLKERIGQNVNKGDLIAVVHRLNTVTAEITISEKEIADVKLGQQVVLKTRAYPQEKFEGRVTFIAPSASKQEGGQGQRMFLVMTRIDNGSLLLRSDMTGNAKIHCGKRRVLDLLTRRLVRYLRVEFWSWW